MENTTEKYDEVARKESRGEHLTILDKYYIAAYTDPVHLAQQINRELNELNKRIDSIFGVLKKGYVVLILILITLIVIAFRV